MSEMTMLKNHYELGGQTKIYSIKTTLRLVLVFRMAHRKWKESKQQPSMLPGPAVPGCCLVSFHILWAILSTSTVKKD